MAWILATIITLILLGYLLPQWVLKKGKRLPPGPKGFPIIGSLHLLGKLIHRDLHHLSQIYGPIMHMKLGSIPAVIVSSPRAAELFLKTHDLVFAARPLTKASNQISCAKKGIAFAEYGPYWRNIRKICTNKLLNSRNINSFSSTRSEEVDLLIDHLRNAGNDRVAVDLSSKTSCVVLDIICRMLFGKKYEDKDLEGLIQEATQLAAAPNLGDFIPCIGAFDLQGLCCRPAKRVGDIFDGFLERIIDEHFQYNFDNKNEIMDFVEIMLDFMGSPEIDDQCRVDRSSIKAVILDLVLAAVDTTATSINWVLPELIKHPQEMKKVQKELQQIVGLNRKVKESDLIQLKYLEMAINESLRLHPPIPLVPRESIKDSTVNGYHIPNKSRIVINAWAIGRDSTIWSDPNKFIPQRFDEYGQKGRESFELIPFGYGRRGCPGKQFALVVVRLVVAQLVHCFDWELPNGMSPTELDMTEEFGLTCPRAQNLRIIPIYRLCN